MSRMLTCLCAALLPSIAYAAPTGKYIEARTCQVYTGPCFANGETGAAGKEAIMAWSIEKGDFQGVDISGLSVVMVIRGDRTLAFQGINDARHIKSLIIVDEKASGPQREALAAFARAKAGKAGEEVVDVQTSDIEMSLDIYELSGKLTAGKDVKLVTRKARPEDCICSNESAYYPPLAKVDRFVPGVTIEGEFKGRGLGVRWEMPDARNVYMGTFSQ